MLVMQQSRVLPIYCSFCGQSLQRETAPLLHQNVSGEPIQWDFALRCPADHDVFLVLEPPVMEPALEPDSPPETLPYHVAQVVACAPVRLRDGQWEALKEQPLDADNGSIYWMGDVGAWAPV